jgi:hypothetical protein
MGNYFSFCHIGIIAKKKVAIKKGAPAETPKKLKKIKGDPLRQVAYRFFCEENLN